MGAVLDLFNVLHEPTAVFSRLKERPRVLVPWLVLSVLVMVCAILAQPYQTAAMEAFRATLSPDQAARMTSGGGSVLKAALGAPLAVLLQLALGAGFLWLGMLLTGAEARYKTLMSVLAHALMTFVIFSAITVTTNTRSAT